MTYLKMAVAVDQHHGFKSFARPPRCRLQSYSQLDRAMPELTQTTLAHSLKQAFQVATIHRSFSTPCLPLAATLEGELLDANPRIEIIGGNADTRVRALVVEVAIAMAFGVIPMPVSSGLGGTYFLRGRNNDTIAVAKPIDEEPLAFNNPKGFAGKMLGQSGVKRSIRVGETGLRELAAYLLDHGGFAGVPPTALVKISHVEFHVNNLEAISAPPYKIASLQRFVDHDSDAGDLGPSGFSVSSIHRIGILDVRLLNLDRHAGNMLVKRGHDSYSAGAAELIPIDHGLCLPEWLDDPYFEWLHWPQASVPFSESEVEYILNLDPFRDAELLRNELPSIRESSIRVLVLCTIFLKQAVAAGLCLADMGEMMTPEFRGGEENVCVLENLCLNANATMRSILNDRHGKDYQCEEETEIFQLDNEWEEDSSGQALDLPELFQGKPARIARFSSRSMSELLDAALPSLHEEDAREIHDDLHMNNDDRDKNTINHNNSGSGNDKGNNRSNGNDKGREYKVGGMPRSMSFAVSNQNHENGGISFGEINKEEWGIFLENFEKLLPKVFEGRKNIGLMKQRLGSSCEF